MNLSRELEKALTEEIEIIEEDRKMSIVTSAERKGRIEGLHESIYDIFEIKFGKNIYELYTQLRQIQDIEVLQKIRLGLKQANSLEETRNLILLQLSNCRKN